MNKMLSSLDRRLSSALDNRWAPAAVLAAAAILYIFFPTRNWNYADDSLRWAYEISIESGIINTHHLYLNLLRPVYNLLSVFHPIDPAGFLSLYSAVFGIAGLYFLYRLLSRIVDRSVAVLGTAFCATSAGYWSYAIVGDAYVPTIALMLGGFHYYFAALEHGGDGRRLRYATGSVVCFFGMLLHHQALALVVVGIFFGSLAATRYPLKTRLKLGILVPALTGLITIAMYLGVYTFDAERNRDQSPAEYMAGYAETFVAYPDMKNISFKTLVEASAGIGTSLLSSNFLFASDTLAEKIQDRFPYRHVYPYPFLVRNLGPPAYIAIAVSVTVCTLALLVLIPAGAYLGFRSESVARPIFVASLIQVLFFVWWEAISDEFWLWFIPIVAIAVSLAIGKRVAFPRAAYVLLIAPLAASTYLGAISLYRDKANDLDLVNDAFVYGLGENDLLIAMDEIVTMNRNRLAMLDQGFEYFNIFGKASKGEPVEIDKLEHLITQTERTDGEIYVAPYVSSIPKSYLELIELNNPGFEDEYASIIELIESRDDSRVEWIEPEVAPREYFRRLRPDDGPGAR